MQQPSTYEDLLSRWLRGETTRREERELERLAREDPFLAEALEGYRRQPEGTHEKTLTRLRERLEAGRDRQRSTVFYLTRIAAALVVLLIAAGGLWIVNQPEGGERVAQEMEQPRLEPAPISPSPSADATEETAADPEAEAAQEPAFTGPGPEKSKGTGPRPEAREQIEPTAPPPPPTAYTQRDEPEIALEEDAGTKALPAPVPDEQPTAFEEEMAGLEIREEKTQAPPAGNVAPSAPPDAFSDDRALTARRERAKESDALSRPRRISGRVIEEESGEPLIGANVIVEGATQGTVTDFDGNFQLTVPAGTDQLRISYIGYSEKAVNLSPTDTIMEVRLYAGAPVLDEVVVTGLAVERKQASSAAVSSADQTKISGPQPRGGFDRLEKHLRRNKTYPAEAAENGIEGSVLLAFTVDERGRPQDIEVVRSLGYGCDEEAVRLIEEGPRWKEAKPGEKIRYAISFGKAE